MTRLDGCYESSPIWQFAVSHLSAERFGDLLARPGVVFFTVQQPSAFDARHEQFFLRVLVPVDGMKVVAVVKEFRD